MSHLFFRPFGADSFPFAPRARALGSILTPLRSYRAVGLSRFFRGSRLRHRLAEGLAGFVMVYFNLSTECQED